MAFEEKMTDLDILMFSFMSYFKKLVTKALEYFLATRQLKNAKNMKFCHIYVVKGRFASRRIIADSHLIPEHNKSGRINTGGEAA